MESAALSESEVKLFRERLLAWFAKNARDLPWRRTRDPYRIWVSEIMLQQTRVAAVVDRYNTFVARFPSLVSLALAKEEDVLALWSGLGYYRRARMMHSAAQRLVLEHGASLPKSSIELRSLPGVGDYTAAAIASIAYGEPVAVLDGNVERVLMRMMGKRTSSKSLPETRLRATALHMLDTRMPGAFNQAMMELGATVCLPKAPLCITCPVQEFCRTRGEHAVRPRKQMRSREISYALIRKPIPGSTQAIEVLLVQRPSDISQMPGMWELPTCFGSIPSDREPILRVRHSITNTNYYVRVYEAGAEDPLSLPDSWRRDWVSSRELGEIPLTGLARKILMRLEVFARPTQVRRGKALPGVENVFL